MNTADRVLTLRELNRATLARQMVLEREDVPPLEAPWNAWSPSRPRSEGESLVRFVAEPQGATTFEIRFGQGSGVERDGVL